MESERLMIDTIATLTVDYDDNGDAVLNLPDDLIHSTGWEPGTTLEWINNNDGTFTLRKATN